MTKTISGDEFVNHLRRALQRLYDPIELRRSPLVELFGLDRVKNQAAELRSVLTSGVAALKPEAYAAPGSVSLRTYHILTYRFIEQMSQKEVAGDMAISLRQLQRLEGQALRELALLLAERNNLSLTWGDSEGAFGEGVEPDDVPTTEKVWVEREDATPVSGDQVEREIGWLRANFALEKIDLRDMVRSVLTLLQPVFLSGRASVDLSIEGSLPPIRGQETSIRQALLNILETLLFQFNYSHLTLTAAAGLSMPRLTIRAERSVLSDDDQLSAFDWSLTAELLEISSARINTVAPNQVEVEFQVFDLPIVMVVDDNQDTLLLLERYLTGSAYRFLAARGPQEALNMVAEVTPDVVLLDVMLPGIDGWTLLDKMRRLPALRKTCFILSSILPSERTALMLGADGFLRKPFSRQDLLGVLDRWKAAREPGSD